ncbi:cutinase family protein [Aeromicrobium endophyticum]|uniref:cutinase family protein n=1 Tax=Aeromicrobium endophyticum TaxID=2292704 RepID=UPI0018F38458|nr:cutinase family protein [Aeromicrobium endophyticum]
MTPRLTRAAAAVAVLLGLGGCSAHPDGPDRPRTASVLTDRTCADLVVIGARGSMQRAGLNLGVGTEVRVTVEQLARRLQQRSHVSVHVEPVLYDSSPTPTAAGFLRNTAAGGTLALGRLTSLAARCPSSRFALVGFSQGAHVVHTAAMAVPSSLTSRVALVAMIADPANNPDDQITRWSYASEPTSGHGRLGAGPPIPAALRRTAISFCVAGDAICNDRGAPGTGQSPTHKHFYERPATAEITAARLDRVLRANGV